MQPKLLFAILFVIFQIKASVLYINPTTKAVTLTQLTHLVTPDLAPRRPFGALGVGDIIEEATVRKIAGTRGVYFKLADHLLGFAYVSWQDGTLVLYSWHDN